MFSGTRWSYLAGIQSPSAHRGEPLMFLSLDGIDGVGKSTQLQLLVKKLQHQGHEVVTCREPGSTPLGEAIRELLLNDWNTPMNIVSEMLLYMTSRAQLVQEVIRPALAEGKIVIADRYLLASVVYQGYGGGVDTEAIWNVGRVATGDLLPDRTIVLDLPLNEAANRLGKPDRIEARGDDYREALRAGFTAEAERHPEQIELIDARGTEEDVATRIWNVVEQIMESGTS